MGKILVWSSGAKMCRKNITHAHKTYYDVNTNEESSADAKPHVVVAHINELHQQVCYV